MRKNFLASVTLLLSMNVFAGLECDITGVSKSGGPLSSERTFMLRCLNDDDGKTYTLKGVGTVKAICAEEEVNKTIQECFDKYGYEQPQVEVLAGESLELLVSGGTRKVRVRD